MDHFGGGREGGFALTPISDPRTTYCTMGLHYRLSRASLELNLQRVYDLLLHCLSVTLSPYFQLMTCRRLCFWNLFTLVIHLLCVPLSSVDNILCCSNG